MSKAFTVRSKLRNYEVYLVNDFCQSLAEVLAADPFIIIDKKVAKLYHDQLKATLPKGRVFPVEATEFNKSLGRCNNIIKSLIEANIQKKSIIIAIGGGVVQDIAAFISSILYRGVDWIFFPTTLLAQADSCIGGKTSINYGIYKNLLGNFYPPVKIYIDTGLLETLPAEELKSGIGEMLHFYFIAGSKLAKVVMDNYKAILRSPRTLAPYIKASLLIKKRVIEIDEFDKGLRKLFNYGHTFGHAIEAVSHYRINHGQAVSMGMDIANYLSLNLGYLTRSRFEDMHRILNDNLPVFYLPKNKLQVYLKALARDKKNIGNNLGCILTRGPGAMINIQLPFNERFKDHLVSYFYR